jgi:hypothetical protein
VLSCKDVAEILAGHDFESLSWHRRMALRMHAGLCGCHFCRDYGRQVTLLRSMFRRLAEEQGAAGGDASVKLGPEARDRICASLRASGRDNVAG